LSILDALFRAVEERNVRVTWPKEEGAALTLDCGSVKLGLCLSEIFNSRPHVVSPEEEARRKRNWAWSPPKRDYEATRLLRIALHCDKTTSERHTWSEGRKKKKVEECVGEVVAGIEPLVLGNSPRLHDLDTESLQPVQELLAFCAEYADTIDPLCHLKQLLRDFEKPRSWYDP
jgi:hypothetical protein